MYERSGNGHGNIVQDVNNQQDILHVDDDRKDYLGTNKSSLLYFWELADRFEILKSTMAELSPEQAATTENIPIASQLTVIQKERKRKAHDKSDDALAKIGKGIESIASSSAVDSVMQVIRSCESTLEVLFTKMDDSEPGTAKYKFYETRITENTKMLDKAQATMNSMLENSK